MFDLVFVILCVTALLGFLAHAALREDPSNRATLQLLQQRRRVTVTQQARSRQTIL